MHYLIYKITNRLNNKFYVGKHKTENKDDGYFGSGLLLERAVKKHGKENFVKEILFELATEDDMNQKEADIVDEEFVARLDTYNIRLGGEGGWDAVNSQKSKHRTTARMGSVNRVLRWNNDTTFRQEYGEKLSSSIRLYQSVNGNPFSGRKHTDETKNLLREKMKGRGTGKNNPAFGKKWITNGIISKMANVDGNLPVGWRVGRT
jgi:group I intron endonuclease